MNQPIFMLLILYLTFSLFLVVVLFPTPSPYALAQLLSHIFSTGLSTRSRFRLFAYFFSILSFFPVILLLAPIDLVLAFIYSIFNPASPPVFICGTPRSGSTLLHRLLIQSSDRLYGITHFEWRYPSLTFQLLSQFLGIKKYFSSLNYWGNSAVSDIASKMHPNTLGDYEEDAILFEERVGFHPYQFLHLPKSSLNKVFSLSSDPLKSSFFSTSAKLFRLYRVATFVLHPLKYPSTSFVSKEVASNEKLPRLYRDYPSARFIVITRHPRQYLSSLKPLLENSTISKTSSDAHLADTSWWNSWYEWLCWQALCVTSFFNQSHSSNNRRVLHVSFESLVSDPASQLSRIYEFLGLPMDAQFYTVLDRFISSQGSRRRGYEYSTIDYEPSDFSAFMDTFYPLP